MGIELNFTGMCEGCQVPDLVVNVKRFRGSKGELCIPIVYCKHQQACERQRGMVFDVDKFANSFMFKTCGQCKLFNPVTNYFRDGVYCVRVCAQVTHDTTACKDFVPRDDKRRDEDDN